MIRSMSCRVLLNVSTLPRSTTARRFYNIAVARSLPDSFDRALASSNEPVNLETAHAQHVRYVQALRSSLPVLELPPLSQHPDCCFVEDTAICIGNTALITRPGNMTRQGETSTIAKTLQQLGMKVVDMNGDSCDTPETTLDGGDVLYTGRHLFVGRSGRTQANAATTLEAVFDRTAIPIQTPSSHLHLKSVVSHVDEFTLVAPTHAWADAVLAQMNENDRDYEVVRLPNVLACNVVRCNHLLLVQTNGCQESLDKLNQLAKIRNLVLMEVDMSELAKKDGALTCCSLLLNVGVHQSINAKLP